MELKVGKDLFALCGKCDATWHVIVAMDGGKVTKVQCKQCMGYHRYRVPPGEANVNQTKAAAKPRRAVGSSKTAAARPKATPKDAMPLIAADLSRPVRAYAMTLTYEPGERIDHPKFGEGIVESLPEPGKVSVFFQSGRRTLAHGRTASPPL